jgi:hypothetical protein
MGMFLVFRAEVFGKCLFDNLLLGFIFLHI